MKLLIVIGLALIFLTSGISDVFHWHWPDYLGLDQTIIELLVSIFIVAIILVGVFILGILLAVGIAGILGVSAFVIAMALIISGSAIVWPILLMGFVIWLLVSDNKQVQDTEY